MKLHADPTLCQGYGLCHEKAPASIELDEWGYAVVKTPDIAADQVEAARAAVGVCPNAALRLEGK